MNLPHGFTPVDLGILLSYRCQCACDHCLYNCGPSWEDWMQPQELSACLQYVSRWTHPFQVHFTGGEPFLNFSLLLYGVELAARLGIPSYVETNAGWCLDETLTMQRFEQLRTAGLGGVQISCSPFHAAHIPLERTQRALGAAIQVFGMQRVWVYQGETLEFLRRFDANACVPLPDSLAALDGDGQQLWDGCGLIGGGRAGMRLGTLARRFPPGFFEWANCRPELTRSPHSHLDLYGNIIPGFCAGITLGDWRATAPAGEPAGREELLACLAESGPYGLYRLAAGEYTYRALPDGYADKCHLCVHVRQHLHAAASFQSLAPAGFYHTI